MGSSTERGTYARSPLRSILVPESNVVASIRCSERDVASGMSPSCTECTTFTTTTTTRDGRMDGDAAMAVVLASTESSSPSKSQRRRRRRVGGGGGGRHVTFTHVDIVELSVELGLNHIHPWSCSILVGPPVQISNNVERLQRKSLQEFEDERSAHRRSFPELKLSSDERRRLL